MTGKALTECAGAIPRSHRRSPAKWRILQLCTANRAVIVLIWAARNDGPGATFSFSIPRCAETITTRHPY